MNVCESIRKAEGGYIVTYTPRTHPQQQYDPAQHCPREVVFTAMHEVLDWLLGRMTQPEEEADE